MENQHAKIKGYRDLSPDEISWMNHLKDIEHNCGVLLNSIAQHCATNDQEAGRWAAIARNHLETGFMFAIKAVARPSNGLGRRDPDHVTLEQAQASQADPANSH